MEGNVKVEEAIKSLKGKLNSIPQIDNTLTKEGCAADAKMVGDRLKAVSPEYAKNIIYDNEKAYFNSTDTQGVLDELGTKTKPNKVSLWSDINIENTKGFCYVVGNICTLVFDFTTVQDVSLSGIPLYADLPMPKENFQFSVPSMDNKMPYWLMVTTTGHLSTGYVNDIPNGTRLFGTFTYVIE